ncbi:MAG: phosphoribosyltransferase [Campylobacterales bacterium]|nr:phosphoribosyltransferase [Campylobacterales bacterium]
MRKIYYGYDTFRQDLKILVQKIDREFDTILAIARGGLSIAHMLGEYYNIRAVYAINTIGYEDTQKLQNVTVFNVPDLHRSKHVLIVDDIVDSGDTIVEVLKVLKQMYPQTNFYIASLFYKKSAKIAPDWYVKDAEDWVSFFWTVDLLGE